ncbi:hypothetical protein [Streptomyces sp. NPDC053367]|uniref:hypothetical protein n=1 Tax=Streptomyces sp. NPDC053367 TaxID=3365700 RepID=UPI0037D62654
MTMTQQTMAGRHVHPHDGDRDHTAEDIRSALSQRLEQLRRDEHAGMQQLRRLVEQQSSTREALLRISGAIQVLEDLLRPTDSDTPRTNGASRPDPESS